MNITFSFTYKKLIFYLLTIIILFFSVNLKAQNIDSLENILPFKKGIEKAKLLNELANLYKINSFNRSYQYANQAFVLATTLSNNKEQANATYTLGVIYYMKGDNQKALYYWEKTIRYRKADNDQIGLANILSNIGLIYINIGNYNKAIEYFNNALLLHTQLKNKKGLANVTENIGVVYDNKGDYEKAIEYYQKSLKIEEELENKLGVSQSLNSIAYPINRTGG